MRREPDEPRPFACGMDDASDLAALERAALAAHEHGRVVAVLGGAERNERLPRLTREQDRAHLAAFLCDGDLSALVASLFGVEPAKPAKARDADPARLEQKQDHVVPGVGLAVDHAVRFGFADDALRETRRRALRDA